MKRLAIACSLLSLLTFSPVVEANDIEDLFKAALRGSSRGGSSRGHDGHANRFDSRFRQSAYRGRHESHQNHGHPGFDNRRFDVRRSPARSSSFSVSIGLNNSRSILGRGSRVAVVPAPAILAPAPRPIFEAPAPRTFPVSDPTFHGPALPAPPVPVLPISPITGPVGRSPHTRFGYGELVDCDVPLFARIRVKDRDNIHPHAVDVVIAVKDPNNCHHACTCCEKRSVFVPICVPPCPPESVEVSRDGSRMELDYGDYEVDITSRNGVVTVDYDD